MLLFIVALMFWYGSHQLADGHLAVSDFFIALEAVVFGSLQAGQVSILKLAIVKGRADAVFEGVRMGAGRLQVSAAAASRLHAEQYYLRAKSAAASVLALFKREIEIDADSTEGATPTDVKGLITLKE